MADVVNRLDALPVELQTRVWVHVLADRLLPLGRIVHTNRDEFKEELQREGWPCMFSVVSFISELCGVDVDAFRGPTDRWHGPSSGYVLFHFMDPRPYHVPPWHLPSLIDGPTDRPDSRGRNEMGMRRWADVLCLDASQNRIEFAGENANRTSVMEVARLLRKQKADPRSLSLNDEHRLHELMEWSSSFFSPVCRRPCSRRNELKNIERLARESIDCELARSFFKDAHDESGARIF
jgi:hypothetical protein